MDRAVRAHAGNGMATVQMGVHVDERGPKMAALQIDDPINSRRLAHGEQARNPALFYQNVQKKGAFGILGGTRHRIAQFGRNPRLGQEQAARGREGQVWVDLHFLGGLSLGPGPSPALIFSAKAGSVPGLDIFEFGKLAVALLAAQGQLRQ